MCSDSFKESYREIIEAEDRKVFARRDDRYKELQRLIELFGMDGYCAVHPEFLWRAVLDYFKDVNRLKKSHGYTFTQIEKIYAYELYWYLTNNVIQVTDIERQMNDARTRENPKRVFANEYILSYWVMNVFGAELESSVTSCIQSDEIAEQFKRRFENHKSVIEFRDKLYYAFRHRTYTQETLLLALEGFRAGVEFMYSNILVQG
jgi:hypothetical protein